MFLGIIKFGRSISGDKKKNIILHSIRNMKLGVCSEGWYKNYFNKVNCNESMTLRSVYKHLMPSKIRNKNKCCERTHQKRIDNNSRNVSVIILHRKFNAVSLSFSRISYTRKVLFRPLAIDKIVKCMELPTLYQEAHWKKKITVLVIGIVTNNILQVSYVQLYILS